MHYESDIFISYAHLDNQSPIEEQEGWITHFHRALEVRVGQLLGKKPEIWRDPKLQGNDYIEETLLNRLPKVALLVSVLSPRYIRSEWCTRELEEFCRGSEETGGVRIGDKCRIFKVFKTPIPLDEQPKLIQPLRGYEFFKIDPETGRERELDLAFGPEAKLDFWIKLNDLAHDVRDLLESIHGPVATSHEEDAAQVERETVYLADTSFDLHEQRAAIKRDLDGHGVKVLPDHSLPLIATEVTAFASHELARCRLSVHMIGRHYGVVPEGTTKSQEVMEHELAIERSKAEDFIRLIWIPPGLEFADERQQKFFDTLQTEPGHLQGADLLETSLEDLKTIIHQKLALAKELEKNGRPSDVREPDISRIYLIPDQRDGDATRPLEDYLFDCGYEVILPLFEGDEGEVRSDHEENLAICDALLIFWGAGDRLWLRRKGRELMKIRGYGRTQPPLSKAVYIAPPMTVEKERYRTQEALVLRSTNGFEPAVLAPFLNEIKARASERPG